MIHAFAALLLIHGLIHGMGFAKAFGLAELPQLTTAISRPMGVAWLGAGVLVCASAASLYVWPRAFWIVGALGCVLSQIVIVSSWSDAKFGTAANVLLALGVVVGLFLHGPISLRAEYDEEVRRGFARSAPERTLVTEAELARLPRPVQAYLRVSGSVGQRVPRAFSVRMKGRIRSGPDKPWMEMQVEQQSFLDVPTRLFYLRATMFGLPVAGLHRFVDKEASMRIRALGFIPVAQESGPDFWKTETVTLLNDLCVMAPAALVDPSITWEEIDARTARATYMDRRSVLVFDDEGKLVDFWSDDRPALVDGKLVAQRWSTPITEYGSYGPLKLARRGEGRYRTESGEYAYLELELSDIRWE